MFNLSFLTTLEYLMFNPAKSNKYFNSSNWQDLWPRLNMSFDAKKNCVALCGMTKYRIFAHSQWSTVQNYVTCWNVSLLPFIFADLFSSIDWLETQHLESTLPQSKQAKKRQSKWLLVPIQNRPPPWRLQIARTLLTLAKQSGNVPFR